MANVVRMSRRKAWLLVIAAFLGYVLLKQAAKGGLKLGIQAGGPWWESVAVGLIGALMVGLVASVPISRIVNRRRFAALGMRRKGWNAFDGTVAGTPLRVARPQHRNLLLASVSGLAWEWSAPARVPQSVRIWAVADRKAAAAERWSVPPDPVWEEFFRRNEAWLATAPPEARAIGLGDGRVRVESDRSLLRQDLDRMAHWTADLARRVEQLPRLAREMAGPRTS